MPLILEVHTFQVRISQSDVITVQQGKSGENYILRFSLCNSELLEYFSTFFARICSILRKPLRTMKMLIKHFVQDISHGKNCSEPNNGGMNDNEVMGLIGELLFMQDYMISSLW